MSACFGCSKEVPITKRVCVECDERWLARMREILKLDNILPLYGMYVDYSDKKVKFGGTK